MSCTTLRSFRNVLRRSVNAVPLKWRNTLNFTITEELHTIEPARWNRLNTGQSTFLDYNHLLAISNPEHTAVRYHFCIFQDEQKDVGIAVFQIAELHADGLHERIGTGKIAETLGKAFLPGEHAHILICGTAFATGEHGYAFDTSIPVKRAMNALCAGLTEVLRIEEDRGVDIAAMLIKDFYNKSFDHAVALETCGFRSFDVDHNMEMPILSEWQSFDDYLFSLNSKFRTKANAAFKRSEDIVIRELLERDIEQYQERIQALYHAVHEKADFKLGYLNCALLCHLKKKMQDDFIFTGYFLDDEMIGFSIAINAAHQLEAFIVGIDYKVNQQYALYSRMLYDYIALGIKLRKNKIVFGRTAGEIKSTVGAFPVALKSCIRHPGKLSNVLLNVIFKYVEPETFPVRNPYKATTLQKLNELGYSHL